MTIRERGATGLLMILGISLTSLPATDLNGIVANVTAGALIMLAWLND